MDSITIPDALAQQFQNLLTKLETETGELFELKINKFGTYSNQCLTIGAFKDRKKFIVYNMVMPEDVAALMNPFPDPEVSIVDKASGKQVQGKTDPMLQKLRDTFSSFPNSSQSEPDTTQISFKDKLEVLKDLEGEYSSIEEIKQKINLLCTPYRYFGNTIRVDAQTGHVYHSEGGSVAICHTVGYIKIN